MGLRARARALGGALALCALLALGLGACAADRADESEGDAKPALEEVGEVSRTEKADYARAFEERSKPVDAEDARISMLDGHVGAGHRPWTVLVYMVGSNLESQYGAATDDMREMRAAGVDFSMANVVVYAGGSRRWNADIPNNANSVIDISLPEDGCIVGQTRESVDMGAPQTLQAFLDFAHQNYPADNTALVFWNHGGGPLWGYGADELFDNDTLSLAELGEALDASGFAQGGISLVGFDACLMGGLENAALWADYADYLVASEEVEAGAGWDYSFLGGLNGNPGADALAQLIVDSFGSYYEEHVTPFSDPDATLAAYDLAKVGALLDELDSCMGELEGKVDSGSYAEINRARAQSKMFGLTASSGRGDGYDLVDLGDFAARLSEAGVASAQGVCTAIDDMVIAQTSNVESTHGVSLYLPGDNRELYEACDAAGNAPYLSDSHEDFTKAYAARWFTAAQVDWGLAAAALSDEGVEYLLPLTQDQAENVASAHLTVMDDWRGGGYRLMTRDVQLEIDAEGVVHIPSDPLLVACLGADGSSSLWCAQQLSADGGNAVYQVSNTRLLADYYVGGISGATDDLNLVLAQREGSESLAIQGFSPQEGVVGAVGHSSIEAEQYHTIANFPGNVVSPTRDADGVMLPYTDWEANSWIVMNFQDLDGMSMALVPVSETDKAGLTCQVTLLDVNGSLHGSEIWTLPDPVPDHTIFEQSTERGAITYELHDDHAEAVGYEGDDALLVFPGEVEGLPLTKVSGLWDYEGHNREDNEAVESVELPDSVVELGEDAFAHLTGLSSVSLGRGVKTIGKGAFLACNALETLDLPDGVEYIGHYAFSRTGVHELELPRSLRDVGSGAFLGAGDLESFSMAGASEAFSVRDGVLFSADGATLVAYPSGRKGTYEVPEGVVEIADGAFEGARASSVSLPEGLQTIGNFAFAICALEGGVDLPDSVQTIGACAFGRGTLFTMDDAPTADVVKIGPNVSFIGDDAFNWYEFSAFEVSEDNPHYASSGGFLTNKAQDTILQVPTALGDLVQIPDGITTLPLSAFSSCAGAEFIMPDSLFRIPVDAFPWQMSGDNTTLYTYAQGEEDTESDRVYDVRFHCSEGSAAQTFALRHDIEYDTVTDRAALEHSDVVVEQDGFQFDFMVYGDHAALVAWSPDNRADPNRDEIRCPTEVEGVPVTSTEFVQGRSFDLTIGAYGGRRLILPGTLESIDARVLGSCPVSSYELDGECAAFQESDGVLFSADGSVLVAYPQGRAGAYEVPDGVEEIGADAFRHAEVQAVELPKGLDAIGKRAFRSSRLERIDIPGSVDEIGDEAFYLCSALVEANLGDGVETIGKHAFDSSGLQAVRLPQSVERIGGHAFSSVAGYAGLELPDGLEYVGERAFGSAGSFDTAPAPDAPENPEAFHVGEYVSHIGFSAFNRLNVSGFEVAEGNEWFSAAGPLLMSADGKRAIFCAAGVSGEVRIPDGATSIESGCFEYAGDVTDIYVPASVTRLESTAFLAGVRMPEKQLLLHCASDSAAARFASANGIDWVAE